MSINDKTIVQSNFDPFPSTVEGIFEYLITLRQSRLSFELQDTIQDLEHNQSHLVTEVANSLNASLSEIALVDDFKDHFDSLPVKICWAVTIVTDFFISTPLFIFFIMYDKYGEDPMKRSIYNYLMSQGSYTVILQTLFYAPTSAWRVYIGPLNSFFADLNVFIVNTSLIWTLLVHSEALTTRAMLATKFKYISGINDNFFSSFLFMTNVGFTFGSHFCLFFLGSLGSDDMLTGVKKGKRPLSIFYVITIGATSIVSAASSLVIAIKKMCAYYKDKNTSGNINALIKSSKKITCLLNTSKYNKPIVSAVFVVANILAISGCLTWYMVNLEVDGSFDEHIQKFWFAWAGNLLFKTIIPIFWLIFWGEEFRAFVRKSTQKVHPDVSILPATAAGISIITANIESETSSRSK